MQHTTSSITLSSDTSNPSGDGDDNSDSDLDGFIVRDDETPRPKRVSTKHTLPLSDKPSQPGRFFEPTQFTATQDTADDDDMPDMGELLGQTQAARSSFSETRREDDLKLSHGRKRRRVVVDDSDGD
jgi:hypothetical protein